MGTPVTLNRFARTGHWFWVSGGRRLTNSCNCTLDKGLGSSRLHPSTPPVFAERWSEYRRFPTITQAPTTAQTHR
jgi:hypothetical protein